MKDVLVVYFSRSGYTRKIAEQLAARLGAEQEAIKEQGSRGGWRGYWRSAREALRGSLVTIDHSTFRPRDYRLVVLGTPVWAANVSAPVRAYIERHRSEFRSVAHFCTQGGSGGEKVLRKMTQLCGGKAVATACFNDSDIDSARHADALAAFAARIRTRH